MPIIDQSLTSLTLLGGTLLAQARGAYPTPLSSTAGIEETLYFDVAALIAAAEASAADPQNYLRHAIGYIGGGNVSNDTQPRPIGGTQGSQAGTAALPTLARVSVQGKPGDIKTVDLKALLSAQLGVVEADLRGFEMRSEDVRAIATNAASTVAANRQDGYLAGWSEGHIQLLTQAAGSESLLSRTRAGVGAAATYLQTGAFSDTGVLFAYRNITDDEVTRVLQQGKMLSEQSQVLYAHFQQKVGDV